ncbi:hypothetical protein ENUP19_0042G0032 [Entamoeba nuttalli]|uniref:CMP/dCMP-type deaminase domain-containing protein n=1 Tax=Entamoeba nuttalli TaxID=412467 RepID=A0ABQ0DAR8_9EUKA
MSITLKLHLKDLKQQHENYKADYELLEEYFSTKEFTGCFPKTLIDQLKSYHKGQDEIDLLVETLKPLVCIGSCYALCKPSQFPVGGCCYCKESGNAYIGFNMESAGHWIGYSVHGEQCTTNNALIHGEKKIDLLVISYTPCGHCRQYLNQFANRDEFLCHIVTLNRTFHLRELLPFDFRPSDLPSITFPDTSKFVIKSKVGDDVDMKFINQVIDCAKESHVDNLMCYLGVGLIIGKEIYLGNYIESCAHNPSFHPMNGAISQLTLNGKDVRDVDSIILVQYENSPFKMEETAIGIIKGYGYTHSKVTTITIG